MHSKNVIRGALGGAVFLMVASGATAQNNRLIQYIDALPKQQVDAAEQALLRHMRQEEKLARDVYLAMDMVWQTPVFASIAQSEQHHMDLVKVILDRYSLKDPIVSDKLGDFADPVFTGLFQALVLFGIQSEAHALVVGAVIEDLDIWDLEDALKKTDNRDIDTVWQNLMLGSRNHMRAFYASLQARSITYPGLLIAPALLQKIVTTPHEKGAVDENGNPLP